MVEKEKTSRIRLSPTRTNRASEIGHPCERYLYLQRTEWDKAAPIDLGLQFIFDDGKIHEISVITDLKMAGIEVVQQQTPFEWRDGKGRVILSGSIDGMLKAPGDESLYPFDVKGYSPWVWKRLDSVSSFLEAKEPHLRKVPSQMLSYLLLTAKPVGILILKNKATGRLRQVNVVLEEHMDLAEALIKKAERMNEAVETQTAPEPKWDEPVCTACPFHLRNCFPLSDWKERARILDAPELEAKLARWWELKGPAKEYKELDNEVSDELEFSGIEEAMVGPFRIVRKLVSGIRKPSPGGPYSYWKKEIVRIDQDETR